MQIARSARFRHVVFKSAHGGRKHAIDFTPRPSQGMNGDGAIGQIGLSADAPAVFDYRSPPPLTIEEFAFVHWLFEQAGLDATVYRHETIRRRLAACLRGVRAATVTEARMKLECDRAAISGALNAMIIGVTGFFRDRAVFDHLRDEVLPALRRGPGRPRIWSAGCSDGEEPYSVAMLIAEAGLLGDAYMLGTDCRIAAVMRARAGIYDARTLRDVPRALRPKYFAADGAGFRVCDALRAAVQWRTGDATTMGEPGMWDLILCRNMAMYLRPQVAGRLWASLEAALAPGGFLVLGKAERPLAGDTRLVAVGPCIYRLK